MDKKESGRGISEDVTRESLIAISYSEAVKDLFLQSRPENSNAKNVVKVVNGEGDDNYRGKLITMFYTESPDTGVTCEI
ncbi:unnamed protein product [Withania somnifera]